jgi:hypothetical protein
MRLTAYTRGILALPVIKNGSRQAEGGEDVNLPDLFVKLLKVSRSSKHLWPSKMPFGVVNSTDTFDVV